MSILSAECLTGELSVGCLDLPAKTVASTVPIDKKGVGAPGFAEDTDWCRRCGHVETRAMGSPEVELCTEQPQEDVAFN